MRMRNGRIYSADLIMRYIPCLRLFSCWCVGGLSLRPVEDIYGSRFYSLLLSCDGCLNIR